MTESDHLYLPNRILGPLGSSECHDIVRVEDPIMLQFQQIYNSLLFKKINKRKVIKTKDVLNLKNHLIVTEPHRESDFIASALSLPFRNATIKEVHNI